MQSLVDQTNVTIVDEANIPSTPAKPRVLLNLAIGVFGGLLAGFGLAVFLELMTRKVHTKEELIGELDIPLLGHLKNV
jgi:capsular polysaccharide biosynthesis protein